MSVFLRQLHLKKGLYLVLMESNYDPKTKNAKQKVYQRVGYAEDFKDKYADPVAYFKEEAARLSKVSSENYKQSKEEKIPRASLEKNLGHFLVSRVYEKFNMGAECSFQMHYKKSEYDLENVFRFLTFSQIVQPNSKIKEYASRDKFIDDFSFSEDQMYRAVNLIGSHYDNFLEYIRGELKTFYEINDKHNYFDATNIYFEIDKENDMLKRGPEKNNRHDPILGLGLLLDGNGIPLNCTIFPGNQSEQPEMHKHIEKLKKEDNIKGRTIIVADKGLNSGNNMHEALKKGDGYVFSQKVRGSSKENQAWILDDADYKITYNSDGEIIYKVKSEIGEYPVEITSPFNGAKSKINLKQKRVVFYSKDYADKAKHEREKLVSKAYEIVNNPSSFLRKTVGNAASYIKEINYTKDGQIIANKNLKVDLEAIEEEAKLDGYYMIVTSEVKSSDEDIIKTYRGLWEIEETFSIMKGVLMLRPVYAKTIEGIKAHILICFFSLLILRLLQKVYLKERYTQEQLLEIYEANRHKRKNKIRIEKIGEIPMRQLVDFIREYKAIKYDNKYLVGAYNNLIPAIERLTGLTLDRHRLTEADVKKFFKFDLLHTTKMEFNHK